MASKRFVYRLEKVLEIKRQKEDEEKKLLGKLRQALEHEKIVKLQLEEQLENVHIELKTKRLSGLLNIAELRFYPQHIKNLENKIKYQQLRIQELEIKIAEQENAVRLAMNERKAYEKHKENSHAEWLAEADAEEARLLDELATIKFARNLAERQAELELEPQGSD